MRRTLLAFCALALSAPLAVATAEPAAAKAKIPADQALAVVLADPRRDGDRIRDQYRHPAETLAFFKVKPGMTVVDYMPSSGWWTRVLVPYLGEKGRYIGLNPDVRTASDPMKRMFADLGSKFPAQVNGWTGASADRIGAYNTDTLPDDLKGKVDRVMVMREMHNLWRQNLVRRELLAIRDLLKDDGLLGIEQHRARAKADFGYASGNNGYLREKDVIALVEAHGFELVARSELNANRKDPANHKNGVWMLPPNFRGVTDEAEKARLTAIGESDRMTLLFRKRR
ncbi:class I SAM-dependent methyltransferase [Novosphingobium sp. TH158]|uniref:class I SAM-dependent methyltransferase n=1 Tax=Novosphingobium sp. TH158 TaxID=2067455 RepID=UPI000C7CAA1A|nr:class I SAM-dependent methyltransferase [Novosphingobium sp. TH158]PLK24421.1 methyltransferase [Novosphingobium sp. TH158]